MASGRLGRRCQYGALLLLQLCILWFTCVLQATFDFGVAYPIEGRESSEAETSREDEDAPPGVEIESADVSNVEADRVTPADAANSFVDSETGEQMEIWRQPPPELADLRPPVLEAGRSGPSTTGSTLQTIHKGRLEVVLFFLSISVLEYLISIDRGQLLTRIFIMTALTIAVATLLLSNMNEEDSRGPTRTTRRETDREENSEQNSKEEKQ